MFPKKAYLHLIVIIDVMQTKMLNLQASNIYSYPNTGLSGS